MAGRICKWPARHWRVANLATTDVAESYQRKRLVIDATLSALWRMQARFPDGHPPIVDNPSNPGENLARHWREDRNAYAEFRRFRDDFRQQMAALLELRGMSNIADALR